MRLPTRRRLSRLPRVALRHAVPLWRRIATVAIGGAIAIAVGAVGAGWLWRSVGAPAGSPQPARPLSSSEPVDAGVAALEAERDRLATLANAADSELRVERAAVERLAQQVRTLEGDNARLKADLAYLESLLPAGGPAGEKGLSIRRLEVMPAEAAANEYRYRALLVQSGRDDRDFVGNLQFAVSGMSGGKPVTLTLPDQAAPDLGPQARDRIAVQFRRTLRVEGRIAVPAGIVVKSIQMRVVERGAVRAQQAVVL
jgi:hypothetical protein